MQAVILCPKCKKVVKDKKDVKTTQAEGEYSIYHNAKKLRVIKCLECKFVASVDEWQDAFVKTLLDGMNAKRK